MALVLGVVLDRLFISWWRRREAPQRRLSVRTPWVGSDRSNMAMRRVESSDGVAVAVHDFGGRGRALLLSHATGFNAHSYLPMTATLADRFHTFGLDFRGHGDTAAPPGWEVEWRRYGDDALAAARALAPDGGLIGFGHSMGGSALLMAAHRDPSLFELIVAFEPIGSPPLDRAPTTVHRRPCSRRWSRPPAAAGVRSARTRTRSTTSGRSHRWRRSPRNRCATTSSTASPRRPTA